jgi:hypothetical protein
MTRLASILGVATVATLVLLSGCESPTKTDYAKDLEGNWTVTLMGVTNLMPPPAMVPGMTVVTAEILRTGTNKGTVSLTIADTITGAPAPHLMTTVKGSIEVTSDEITVSNPVVMPEAVLAANPAAVQLLAGGLTLEWDLSDDKLTVENETLFSTVLMLGTASLELTKQMANNSSR